VISIFCWLANVQKLKFLSPGLDFDCPIGKVSHSFGLTLQLEMGPDQARAYFWPTVNKRLTRLRPGYFLTRPKEIFFDQKGKKWKIWHFRGNFPNSNPNHKWQTWPDPKHKKLTWPKKFWPGPITYYNTHILLKIAMYFTIFITKSIHPCLPPKLPWSPRSFLWCP